MIRSLTLLGLTLVASTAVIGCRGGETGAAGGGGSDGSGGTPVSDATVLSCPDPGQLPFVIESDGFANEDNRLTAEGSPRKKDESSDTLGVPDGVKANTYVETNAGPAAGPTVFEGRKARTGQSSGLTAIGLKDEPVSLWYYDPSASAWTTLGKTTTDAEGNYKLEPANAIVTEYGRPVYSILEADGTCAEHYDVLLPPGSKLVLTDIDGTMTLSDEELFKQIDDGSYVPLQNESAELLMNTWSDKGYPIVYLTARPHEFRSETREWLAKEGFPVGAVITANSLVFDDSAREYKRAWAQRMLEDYGWEVVAAYGNAESDIDAYEDVSIPKDITFIIGEFAGASGTVAIDNNDFSDHISDFVEQQPDNQ